MKNKNKFKTAFDRGERHYAQEGSEFMPVYEYRINKDTGKKEIVETGKTNIYEMIQASHESTKLDKIIERANGNIEYNLPGGMQDLTETPKSLMEMQNLIIKAETEFAKLPAEIRKKFDNSAEKYISSYGSEEWAGAVGYKIHEKETKKIEKEEVEENE